MTEAIRLDGPPPESIDDIAAANSAAVEEMMGEPKIRALLTSDAPGFVPREIELTGGQLAMIEAAAGQQIIGDEVTGVLETLPPDAAVRFFADRMIEAVADATNAGFVVEPHTLVAALHRLSVSATGRAG
ncbi:MAG TPA: hypothetical protein PKZ99_03205 [Azospirillaceae bacterium]|nr:hypothetical protein [Azospirillaceae bacterium]